jgi:ubiquinone/menaquinone biosynthesis C-methylase UbiE
MQATSFDWSPVAEAWNEVAGRGMPNKGRLDGAALRLLEPQGGETIAELAAGAGELGPTLSEAVGAGGRVVVSDFAAAMVDLIRTRAEGHPNIEVRRIDAGELPFGDDELDGILCRMGYMFVGDKGRAFSEARRSLRPGGRLVFTAWQGPAENLWATCLGMAAMQHGIVLEPELFSLADRSLIETHLARAGFTDVALEEVDAPFEFESFDEYWNHVSRLAGPIAVAIAGRTPEERDAIRETCRGLAEANARAPRFTLSGRAWAVRAS